MRISHAERGYDSYESIFPVWTTTSYPGKMLGKAFAFLFYTTTILLSFHMEGPPMFRQILCREHSRFFNRHRRGGRQ
jgi:hypothetical protein